MQPRKTANERAWELGFNSYQDYLKNSFYWHNYKQRFIRDTCSACNRHRSSISGTWMELHHLTYDRLGNELPEDCVTLCNFCHDQATKLERNGECKLEDTQFFLRKKHIAAGFQMAFNFEDRCNQPDNHPDEEAEFEEPEKAA